MKFKETKLRRTGRGNNHFSNPGKCNQMGKHFDNISLSPKVDSPTSYGPASPFLSIYAQEKLVSRRRLVHLCQSTTSLEGAQIPISWRANESTGRSHTVKNNSQNK